MKAIILLAGYATRLYPLTKNMPKALLEVKGKTILDYIADELERINEINEIVLITNDRFYPNFLEWSQNTREKRSKKYTVVNDNTTDDTNKLGAVKDIWYAVDKLKIDEDIVVTAGDNLFTYDLKESYDIFARKRIDLILAKRMTSLSDLRRMAVGVLDDNNIITDMEEKPEEPKSDIAFFATYFYLKETLPLLTQYLDEGNPPDAPGYFPSWLYKRKPVMAHLFDGECYDIGTFESYEDVKKNFTPKSSD